MVKGLQPDLGAAGFGARSGVGDDQLHADFPTEILESAVIAYLDAHVVSGWPLSVRTKWS